MSDLGRYFKEARFLDRHLQLLWGRMRSLDHAFQAGSWKNTLVFVDRSEAGHLNEAEARKISRGSTQTWTLSIPEESFRGHFLPIRSFRDSKVPVGSEGDAFKTFLSSGTSMQGRSRSRFSEQGLEFYKLSALKAFSSVLNDFFGESAYAIKGYSLIPDPSTNKVWQDSSLAQMLKWFSEFWSLTYTGEDGRWLINHSDELGQKPVFIFGTAAHLVGLYDWGYRTKLPAGSIVIETGGSKGSSRPVDRDELFAAIGAMFAVPESHIVSEYSMSELASQSYDWVRPEDRHKKKFKRRFAFPGWVSTYIMDDPSIAKNSGLGVLLINDRARVDIPWPIQTEDLAGLKAEETFELLGRVPNAPLRGCSMLAQEVLKPKPTTQETALVWTSAGIKLELNDQEVLDRGTKAVAALQRFFDAPSTLNTLTSELKSATASASAVDNIRQNLPHTENDWLAIVKNATHPSTPNRWLIILPGSHSVAGLYPLAVATVAGLSLKVRVPRNFENSNSLVSNFIQLVVEDVARPGSIEVLPSNWKVTDAVDDTCDAILAYGENQTIKMLREVSEKPVSGFGNAITAAFITEDDLTHRSALLAQDAFALAQRGCLSARFAVLFSDKSLGELARIFGPLILQEFKGFWGSSLDVPTNSALVLEEVALRQRGIPLVDRPHGFPLVSFYKAPLQARGYSDLVGLRQFTLPIAVAPRGRSGEERNDLVAGIIRNIPDLSLIVHDSSMRTFCDVAKISRQLNPFLQLRKLGQADAPAWDGLHQGLPLFVAH